jgi:23S rRNA (cytosine1962-C5)-methyltransferase
MQALLDAIATMALPAEARRIFHGRGGLFPGCERWVLDFYPPAWVLTCYGEASEHELAAIGDALARRWAEIAPAGAPLAWVYQSRPDRAEARAESRLMAGSVPEPHLVEAQGARYVVQVLRGQNHGLFLDMAEGRRWVAAQMALRPGQKVLNLFAYTCAFSVAALRGGAASVVNVDMSSGALATGRRNHQLNGVAAGASFLAHDVFSSWGKITRGGPYDLVIIDPPGYQKGSFVASKDYARLMRRLPDLLAPGGQLLLCMTTPKLGMDFLQQQMAEIAPQMEFVQRLPNPPEFADVSADRALKVLVYRRPL